MAGPNQLILFSGGTKPSSSQTTKNAVVERDNNGDTFQNGVNAATYLSAGGSLFLEPATYTANATLDQTATVIKANATSAAFVLTLPPVAVSVNQFYFVIKIDSSGHVPTIQGNGSDNINGANTYTGLTAQYNAVRLWCDGTAWYLL